LGFGNAKDSDSWLASSFAGLRPLLPLVTRSLLSIVNTHADIPWTRCIATGTPTVDLRCHPNSRMLIRVRWKWIPLLRATSAVTSWTSGQVTGFVRLQWRAAAD